MGPPPELAVYVLHWNAIDRLQRSLSTLLASEGVKPNITVVDSGSPADVVDRLPEVLPPGVGLVRLADNVGFSGAANVAIDRHRAVSADDVLFLAAHDILVRPDCLRLMYTAAVERPQYGVLGPAHHGRDLEGPVHWIGGSFVWWRGASFAPPPPSASIGPEGAVGSVVDVDWVPGMLMAVRTRCLDDIGGLDGRLFAYWEDVELCLRAVAAGWKVGIVPGAVAADQGYSAAFRTQAYLVARNHLLVVGARSGRPAQVVVGAYTALRSLAALAGSLVPTRDRDHRSRSRDHAAGRWVGLRDGMSGRGGPPPASVLGRRESR